MRLNRASLRKLIYEQMELMVQDNLVNTNTSPYMSDEESKAFMSGFMSQAPHGQLAEVVIDALEKESKFPQALQGLRSLPPMAMGKSKRRPQRLKPTQLALYADWFKTSGWRGLLDGLAITGSLSFLSMIPNMALEELVYGVYDSTQYLYSTAPEGLYAGITIAGGMLGLLFAQAIVRGDLQGYEDAIRSLTEGEDSLYGSSFMPTSRTVERERERLGTDYRDGFVSPDQIDRDY